MGQLGPTARTGEPLFGRDAELSRLYRHVAQAAAGAGRAVLICGEPGIGKTSLAGAVADRARLRGSDVVWGRCRETEGAPAFWPWTQVLRSLLARVHRPAPTALRLLVEPSARAAGGGERFALFNAVAELLVDQAARQPLVLLLDDLHRADAPSLRLLEFLAPAVQDAPLLVLGTFRDTDVGPDHLLLSLADADLLRLTGLTRADTAQLLARTSWACPQAAEALHERCGGNPFFLQELLRLPPHDATAVPLTVQAAIRARVERLPPETGSLLRIAAVLGRDVPADLLAALAGASLHVVQDRLEPALAGGLITPGANRLAGYRFAHVLVRDALYESIPHAVRAELHDRVVDALEQQASEASEASEASGALDLRASHAVHAVRTPAERRRAVRLTERAGAGARDRLAHEEAVAWFARALEVGDGDPEERFRLLLELGRCAGRAALTPVGRSALRAGWLLAVAQGWNDRLAEVALALGELVDSAGSVDGELVHMLEHALARTSEVRRRDRIHLSARLATELYWSPRLPEARQRADDAVVAARRLGDPRALAMALAGQQFTLRGPDELPERTRLGEELVAAARRLPDERIELQARRLLLADRLQTDRAAAEADLVALEAIAASTRRPLARWYVMVNRCVLTSLAGRPAEALRLVHQTEELGRRLAAPPARMYAAIQRYALLRQQSCGWRSEDELRAVIADYPRVVTLRCALVLLLAEAGRADEAVPLLAQLVADDCAAVPRDALWLASIALLVLAAARLSRVAELAVLERLLAPYTGRVVLQGLAVWWGSADHYLGCARGALGRLAEAEADHQRALRLHRAWDAPPFIRASQAALRDIAGPRPGTQRGTHTRSRGANARCWSCCKAAPPTSRSPASWG